MMQSIVEYEYIAKKILCTRYKPISNDIINDYDKFGEIIYALMMADWKFDGRGNLHGYRKQYVSWTIKNLLELQSRPQFKPLKEKQTLEINEIDELDTQQYVESKTKKSKILTEREKECILDYLINQITITDMSIKYSIKKTSVIYLIRNGLTKLGVYGEYIKRPINRRQRRATCKTNT